MQKTGMRGQRQGGYVHTVILSNLVIKGEGVRKVEIKRQLRETLRWGRVNNTWYLRTFIHLAIFEFIYFI